MVGGADRAYAPRMRRLLVAALLVTTSLAGCSSSGAPDVRGCSTDFTPRRLPTWARTGFSPPTQRMPYVLGDRGDIVAILWADHDPLSAPPRADRNNKILWASPYGGTLRIEATRDGSSGTVVRTVDGGPGPSIIDLPEPGCWTFDLRWGGHHDRLRLGYAPT